MIVNTMQIETPTEGDTHLVDLTAEAGRVEGESGLRHGFLTLFVPGSAAGLTPIEFEPGAVADSQRLFEEIAGRDRTIVAQVFGEA